MAEERSEHHVDEEGRAKGERMARMGREETAGPQRD